MAARITKNTAGSSKASRTAYRKKRSSAAAFAAGVTIGNRFEIQQKLGSGSYADVFQCLDLHLPGRQVAVKVARETTEEARTRFRSQFRLLDSFPTESVARVYDYLEVGKARRAAIVLEAVDGEELGVWSGAATVVERIAIFSKLIDEISRLKAAGLLHGDLKEDNVLVQKGNLRLIDPDAELWGSSRARRKSEISRADPDGSGLIRVFRLLFDPDQQRVLGDLEEAIRSGGLDAAASIVAAGPARLDVSTRLGAATLRATYGADLAARRAEGRKLVLHRREAMFALFQMTEASLFELGVAGTKPQLKRLEHAERENKLVDGPEWKLIGNTQNWSFPEGERMTLTFEGADSFRVPWPTGFKGALATGYLWLQRPNDAMIATWNLRVSVALAGGIWSATVEPRLIGPGGLPPADPPKETPPKIEPFDGDWLVATIGTNVFRR